jgi:predicted HicB family RNase H-like nuclease
MPRVIQIRDVPDEVHQALASAADEQGLSLTE